MMQRISKEELVRRLEKAIGQSVGIEGLNILLYGWKKYRRYGAKYCDALKHRDWLYIVEVIDLSEYADVEGYHVAYRSKWTDFIEPYETDLAEPLEKIYKRFPKHLYDLRITKEDGTVVIDTLSGESE